MFGKKKKKSELRVIVVDAEGCVLIDSPLYECPMQDEGIVALSKEFFNDPNPCEIHRGAVRWRVMDDMRDRSAGNWVTVGDLSPEIRLTLPERAERVRVISVEIP